MSAITPNFESDAEFLFGSAATMPELASGPCAAALDCVKRGWAVLPCEPNGKLPDNRLVDHGVNSASKDPEVIKRWFARYPNINYAVAGGDDSNLSFYDFDDLYDDDTNVDYSESRFPGLHKSFRVRSGRVLKPGQVGGFHLYADGACQSRALFADAALPLTTRPGVKKDGSPLLDQKGQPIMQTFDHHDRLAVNGRVTIGEVRSRGEYVVGYGSHHKSGRDYKLIVDAPLFPNPIQDVQSKPDAPAIGTDQQNQIAGYVEDAFRKAQIEYKSRQAYQGGFKWLVTCPWEHEHTGGKTLNDGGSSSAVFMAASGARGYRCLHAHCQSSRNWEQFRKHMESIAGKLSFTAVVPPKPAEPTQTVGSTPHAIDGVNPNVVGMIPPSLEMIDGALYGILGRIIRKLEPQTESHPMGNLLELMTSVGSVIERTAYVQMEGTKHFCNLFFVRVGKTARSRKGTGKDRIAEIMSWVDSDWLRHKNISGFGSGEAVIWAIRDRLLGPVQNKRTRQWSTEVIDPGVENKTLHINEGEFVGVLTIAGRKDNILSKVIRDGWDGKPLRNTVKTSPCSVMEPYISQACDITQTELIRVLSESEKFNGFANRYLWAYVYRTQELPLGGEPIDWTDEVHDLQQAIAFAKEQHRIRMDRNAEGRWKRMYHDLGVDEPGIVGAVTARAEPQVLRMALIFALLDMSTHIKVEHLEAANAVWQYCLRSARFIFGQTVALPDTLTQDQTKLLAFIASGPKSRTQISVECFRRNRPADMITLDLLNLYNHGYINEPPDGKIFTAKGRS